MEESIGQVLKRTELSDGFILEKMSSPLGVLVIFESRPSSCIVLKLALLTEILLLPEPNREATPTLRPRSLVVHRKQERVVGFKEAPNREGSRRGRNAEGIRPSEIEAEIKGVNLPRPWWLT
nr:delta-1-pyrroline-5-carboxylate synthase-like [Tanacetum cinerariifolium]